MQTIVILDSGFGGLSVAAPVVRQLERQPRCGACELVYYDALPAVDYGYDDLPDAATKAAYFSKVLTTMAPELNPTLIAIACNTLSVLVEQTPFFHNHPVRSLEITQPSLPTILEWFHKHPDQAVSIFGTPTTIRSGVYQQALIAAGIPADHVQAVTCERLPHLLESDDLGADAHPRFQEWLTQAYSQRPAGQTGLSVLACTHFGLNLNAVQHQFSLSPLGRDQLLNPNDVLVDAILQAVSDAAGTPRKTSLKVSYHRFVPRNRALSKTIRQYLTHTSPALLGAVDPDDCGNEKPCQG